VLTIICSLDLKFNSSIECGTFPQYYSTQHQFGRPFKDIVSESSLRGSSTTQGRPVDKTYQHNAKMNIGKTLVLLIGDVLKLYERDSQPPHIIKDPNYEENCYDY